MGSLLFISHMLITIAERGLKTHLYDDIVSVQGDGDHGPDGAAAGEGADGGVDPTRHGPEDPSLVVAVDDERGTHAEHEDEVREGQVDHVVVGGRAQGLGGAEDVHDSEVAGDGQDCADEVEEAHQGVPQGIERRELVPVRVDQVQHVLRDGVHYGVVAVGVGVLAGVEGIPLAEKGGRDGLVRHARLRSID